MSSTMMLSVLLVLGGLGGAAASDLHVLGKFFQGENPLQSSHDSRHLLRKQLRQQTKSSFRRSLGLDSLNLRLSPPTRMLKNNPPTIIKLFPSMVQPLHMHANMPLRFGRESAPGADRVPKSTPNLPQRFGRSWEVVHVCGGCRGARDSQTPLLPQRFGRNPPGWSLLDTSSGEQLLKDSLQWSDNVDFLGSSEEEGEMEGKDLYNTNQPL